MEEVRRLPGEALVGSLVYLALSLDLELVRLLLLRSVSGSTLSPSTPRPPSGRS